jgi:hypothetical protein
MRKLLAVTLAAVLVMGVAPAAHAGRFEDHRRVRKCHGIEWQRGPAKVARLVRCVARAFDPPGTPDYALAIARCESGLIPRVIGGAGDNYLGLYQFHRDRWRGIARHYVKPLELRNLRWQNAEAQAIAAARIARGRGSWAGYWSCA